MGALVGLGILIAGTIAAYAATNTIPNTRLDADTLSITANDLKPSECAALNLTTIVSGSGNIDGTTGNDLILGSAGNDTIQGRQGADCILGGDGDDTLQGSQGGDILLAGNGADSLNGGPGTDVCDGESGTDSGSPTCETELNIP
jgi:Ca2+-binding RTX toxin-like protein